MLLWTLIYKHLFVSLLSILLGIYPELESLGHMAMLYFIFWGTVIWFSAAVALFTFPPAVNRDSNSFTSLTISIPCFFFFLLFIFLFCKVILMSMKWYIIMVSIYMSLVISDVEHLFTYLLDICIYSLEKYLFKSSANLKIRLFGVFFPVELSFWLLRFFSLSIHLLMILKALENKWEEGKFVKSSIPF